MWSFPDAEDLAADVRRLFDELERAGHHGQTSAPSLYAPPLDVVETAEAVDIAVDLPGVSIGDIRLVVKQGTLLLAGEKPPPEGLCHEGPAFHLVERSFGRFARVVRIERAVDAARARATLHDGVLRVTVPRIEDRRGREIVVPIEPQES